jgi:anti-sigma28 factor (negative regulator of flagellin synthesis)
MSMRIQNDGLLGTGASGTSPLQEAGLTNGSRENSGAELSSGNGTDRVDISSFSANLSHASSLADSQRGTRVSQLTSLYASGNYSVDSARVSSALVSQAITGKD